MMSHFLKYAACASLALTCAAVFGAPATAQAVDDSIYLELNSAAPIETGGCRLTFVISNTTETGLSQISYQLGIFDSNQIVQNLLIMSFGEMQAGRTKIVLFDISNRECADISRLLINAVETCTDAGSGDASAVCEQNLATRAIPTNIQLGI